jgi:hypothetical protein
VLDYVCTQTDRDQIRSTNKPGEDEINAGVLSGLSEAMAQEQNGILAMLAGIGAAWL